MAWRSWLLLALLLIPASAAQADPAAGANVLYFHVSNADGCCTSWMNAAKEDANQTLDSVGLLAITPAVANPGAPPPDPLFWPLDASTLSMPLTPALAAAVHLAADGKVEVSAHVGGSGQALATVNGVPVPLPMAGQVEVYPVLALGDQLVARGEPQTATYTEEWVHLTWSLAPNLTVLDPAVGELVWTLVFSGAGNAIVVSASDTPGWTTLTLPVAPPAQASSTQPANATPAESGPSPTSSTTSTTAPPFTATDPTPDGTADDQATGGFPPVSAGQDAPGPAMPLVLAALAALAVALRRRLA